jgi:hypothetical protein
MRRTTRTAVVLALGCLAGGAADASAAWDNVFQTTGCCGESSRSSFFAPAPAPCCPSVSYVQRCFYQPVTTFKTETYFEPVTTYRTSYFWEPVTRLRCTSFFDPCTGCCHQVCTPCTSYTLRAKCNACQSYIQRCRMVPCTVMRKSFYLEPVVTCCDPCPPACPPPCNPCPTGAGVTESTPRILPGGGIGGTGGPAAGINESSEPPRIPPTRINPGSRKVTPVPVTPLRADRIASRERDGGRLAGLVVRDDRITPRANATLKFVNDTDVEVVAKADGTGRFAVELPPGEWALYLPGADGKAKFHSTLEVRRDDDRRVTVVSR